MSNQADQQAPTGPEETGQETQGNTQSDSQQSQKQQDPQTYRQIAATHIDKLSDINEQLPKVLAYFAASISQLTNHPIETPLQVDKADTVKRRQNAMWYMATYVGLAIKEIREELEEQINDLERYGVIPAKHQRYTALPREGQVVKHDPEASVKNGGYGDFDVGVLNARAASGHVGGEDVLDRVKTMVEELVKTSGVEASQEDMVVDG